MSFSDPTTITINAVGKSCVKINQDSYGSEYLFRSSTEEIRMKVRHQTEGAKFGVDPFERHNVELKHTVFAVAPAVTDTVRICSFTIRARVGDDPAAISVSVQGLVDFLTDPNLARLIGWES